MGVEGWGGRVELGRRGGVGGSKDGVGVELRWSGRVGGEGVEE